MGERPSGSRPTAGRLRRRLPALPGGAIEHGWIKEGSPTTPLVPDTPAPQALGLARGLFGNPRRPSPSRSSPEPILRRLSEPSRRWSRRPSSSTPAPYRRTIAGICKSLGEPQASFLPLSGVNPEVVVTVAWDISWYQYRVIFESRQPVRLEERGHELDELDATLQGAGTPTSSPTAGRPGHRHRL